MNHRVPAPASLRRVYLGGIVLYFFAAPLQAYDLNDKLAIGGIAAWAGQCQELEDDAVGPDTCRGALPFQPTLSYRPTRKDQFFVKLGFAVGNGLNDVPPFNVSPWGADLEDDVKNINGRGRNYLLTAWYKHTFEMGEAGALGVSAGIIDATDYLNDNAYANDEFNQFMNDALSNVPSSFLPGYDWGSALVWHSGRWSVTAVAMNVGDEIDDDEGKTVTRSDYTYFGVGLGYEAATALGKGTYRVLVSSTSPEFFDPAGTSKERLSSFALSFDQQLGDIAGAFLRATRVTDDVAVDYSKDVAGGLDFDGRAWGRPRDNIGIGYAYLHGGNRKIVSTPVAEGYYRLMANAYLALTLDLQYMNDENRDGSDAKGFIFGLRTTAEF